MFSDTEVMRYYPSVFTREQTETWIEKTLVRYERDGHAIWAVELLDSGSMIGGIGLPIQDIDGHKATEVGYMLKKQYWGKGYAVEGATSARDYAFQSLRKTALISIIYPQNLSSMRVARKIGMSPMKEIDINGRRHTVFFMEQNRYE